MRILVGPSGRSRHRSRSGRKRIGRPPLWLTLHRISAVLAAFPPCLPQVFREPPLGELPHQLLQRGPRLRLDVEGRSEDRAVVGEEAAPPVPLPPAPGGDRIRLEQSRSSAASSSSAGRTLRNRCAFPSPGAGTRPASSPIAIPPGKRSALSIARSVEHLVAPRHRRHFEASRNCAVLPSKAALLGCPGRHATGRNGATNRSRLGRRGDCSPRDNLDRGGPHAMQFLELLVASFNASEPRSPQQRLRMSTASRS